MDIIEVTGLSLCLGDTDTERVTEVIEEKGDNHVKVFKWEENKA